MIFQLIPQELADLCLVGATPEPLQERGEHHRPVLLEAADPALNSVPGLVVLPVEDGWSATGRASALAVADLVGRFRDRAPDPASAQVGRFAREEYALSPRFRNGRLRGRP